jgi:hypothetical protein
MGAIEGGLHSKDPKENSFSNLLTMGILVWYFHKSKICTVIPNSKRKFLRTNIRWFVLTPLVTEKMEA